MMILLCLIMQHSALDDSFVPHQVAPGQLQPCIFEYIYLARPDSIMNNISVYNFQLELGSCLAKRIK
jgi:amidophosphoribosyltransferase